MGLDDFKKQTLVFYDRVKVFKKLLVESRDCHLLEIVRNHGEIDDQRALLTREYAKLEKNISIIGKNPKMNDGVWNIWYSPYDNAFANDILPRVWPSIDAVINDLDWIIGRLESMQEVEFETITQAEKNMSLDYSKENELLVRIDSAINLAEQKLLKGEELNLLLGGLRKYDINTDTDEILRRKIEKIQREPNTVWNDKNGYAVEGAALLTPWRELFFELVPGKKKQVQKYFRPGSSEEIFVYLKTLVPGARILKIFDPYVDEQLLKLLEHANPSVEIYILGNKFDVTFLSKLSSFSIYFDRNIKVRKSEAAHARFYIVDDNVYNVDVSLKGKGADKATCISPIIRSEATKIIGDFELWWKNGNELT